MGVYHCICGGGNSNCFRCGGTGVVSGPTVAVGRPHRNLAQAASQQVPLISKPPQNQCAPEAGAYVRLSYAKPCLSCGEPISDRVQHLCSINSLHSRSPRPSKTKPPSANCPVCGVKVSNPERHIKRAHPDLVLAPAQPLAQARNGGLQLQRCQVCGVSVKNLNKHQIKTHGRVVRVQDSQTPWALSRRLGIRIQDVHWSSSMTVCPLCQVKTPTPTVLDAHIARAHGPKVLWRLKFASRNAQAIPAKVGFLNHHDDDKRHHIHEPATPQAFEVPQKMDAKYGWGGSFRDHGQFGSYPSHDDMGEESSS